MKKEFSKMGKKLSAKEKKVIKEVQKKRILINDVCSKFYPDGVIADFKFPAVDDDALKSLFRCNLDDDEKKKLSEICMQRVIEMRQNELNGTGENIKVRFDNGTVQSGNNKFELTNTVAMIRVEDRNEYVYFKAGDRCDAWILIQRTFNSIGAVLVLECEAIDKSSNKNVVATWVDEFYLMGICKSKEYKEETGIIIANSLYLGSGYQYCEPALFEPIKGLLLADWLQKELEEAKIANEKKIERDQIEETLRAKEE